MFGSIINSIITTIKNKKQEIDIVAQNYLGYCYYYGHGVEENKEEAIIWYRKAAEQGDAGAQWMLGECYFNGHGVEENKEEAVIWYRKVAEQGDVGVQRMLGEYYFNGHGVEENKEEAVIWYRKAAEQGDAVAQRMLGECYFNGHGVEENKEEAVIWYRKAAKRGNAGAQLMLGECYFNGHGVEENKEEAVIWYRKVAELGYALAQLMLGECYFNGYGVEENKEEAVIWYRKAAEQGNAGAQWMLGECYFNGHGVEENKEEAVIWYRKAAEQGDARVQWMLGERYFNGHGVEENKEEAVIWYRKAAEQGNAVAQWMLGECYFNGHGVEENKEEAVIWYRKAAEQGDARVQWMLGERYFNGHGVEENKEEAVIWYRKAAEQGNALAQLMLGECYFNGHGVEENKEEAVIWYRKAAEQGDARVQRMLGEYYFNGHRVEENKEEAVIWYRKAAEQGDAGAQRMLGECYFNGHGVEENKEEAVIWYRKAAEQGEDQAEEFLEYYARVMNEGKRVELYNSNLYKITTESELILENFINLLNNDKKLANSFKYLKNNCIINIFGKNNDEICEYEEKIIGSMIKAYIINKSNSLLIIDNETSTSRIEDKFKSARLGVLRVVVTIKITSDTILNCFESLSRLYDRKLSYVFIGEKEYVSSLISSIYNYNEHYIINLYKFNSNEGKNSDYIFKEFDSKGYSLNSTTKDWIKKHYDNISRINIDNFISKTIVNYELSIDNKKDEIMIHHLAIEGCKDYVPFKESIEYKKLTGMIGLEEIKSSIDRLYNIYKYEIKVAPLGLKSFERNLNMVFMGAPGTGKTTIARLIANMYFNLGIISKNVCLEVGIKDLIAKYVGQTSQKTDRILNKAKGGLLFIDEAYGLVHSDGNNSFNNDCINNLITFMSDNSSNTAIIFAGYKEEMEKFLNSNPGLVSRIGKIMNFPDYTLEQLLEICITSIEDKGYTVSMEIKEIILENLKKAKTSKYFGNARYSKKLAEDIIERHAENIVTINENDPDSIKTIGINDIPEFKISEKKVIGFR